MELQDEAIHVCCFFFNLANIFTVEVEKHFKMSVFICFLKCFIFSRTPKNKTGTDFTKFLKGLNDDANKRHATIFKFDEVLWVNPKPLQFGVCFL